MNTDYISQLPVDIFIKSITYLPFKDVVNICSSNQKLRSFCNDPNYNIHWKALINSTFNKTYNYQENLVKIWNRLGLNENTYNYRVYTQFVKLLDPITQLTIYNTQNDMNSFNDLKFNDRQRFLALFILKKKELRSYLPSDYYLPFIDMLDMLDGEKISQNNLNRMMVEIARKGSPLGVLMFLEKGANIHTFDDLALRWASENGHMETVKLLLENGADIHSNDDEALKWASENGHMKTVRLLLENGAIFNSY